jgi:hypothetical protein
MRPSVFLFALLASQTVIAQQSDSLLLGGDYYHPGQSKDAVLDNLSHLYDTKNPGGSDFYFIWTKASGSQPQRVVASVTFKNEKLVAITKYWGDFQGEAIKSFEALYTALSSMVTNRNGRIDDDPRFGREAHFTIHFSESKEPTDASQHFQLLIGNKSVSVTIVKISGYAPVVQINESVNQWPDER